MGSPTKAYLPNTYQVLCENHELYKPNGGNHHKQEWPSVCVTSH